LLTSFAHPCSNDSCARNICSASLVRYRYAIDSPKNGTVRMAGDLVRISWVRPLHVGRCALPQIGCRREKRSGSAPETSAACLARKAIVQIDLMVLAETRACSFKWVEVSFGPTYRHDETWPSEHGRRSKAGPTEVYQCDAILGA
jgi:hypothetical protein